MQNEVGFRSDDLDAVGHRLRSAIRALAGAQRLSIARLGRDTGIGEQKLRDRLDDSGPALPTRLSVEETTSIAHRLGVTLTELAHYAETGEGLSLPGECELSLIEGYDPDQQTLPFRHLVGVS